MPGIKHLIECHCFLAIYKSDKGSIPPVHKFPVYSKIDDSEKVIQKIVKCNNCEALHKIIEIGKSQIIAGKDQTIVTLSKDDLVNNLPKNLVSILSNYDCDISSWEHAEDIIYEKRWKEPIVLKREIIDEKTNVKILEIIDSRTFKIRNEVINEFLK